MVIPINTTSAISTLSSTSTSSNIIVNSQSLPSGIPITNTMELGVTWEYGSIVPTSPTAPLGI